MIDKKTFSQTYKTILRLQKQNNHSALCSAQPQNHVAIKTESLDFLIR